MSAERPPGEAEARREVVVVGACVMVVGKPASGAIVNVLRAQESLMR